MNQVSSPPDATGTAEATALPRLSVIIGCYNYGRYLAQAIDSVLSEDVGAEIIVVDDCSTDNSRDVMRSYGDRIIPIYQPQNMGQGAGFNAGWEKATGDLIYFLDADDFVLPGGLRRALQLHEPGILIHHFRMRYTDEAGVIAGVHPPLQVPLAAGDVSRQLREQGRYTANVTSGLIFSRQALERVMPVDPAAFRISADGYLVSVIPLYGPVRSHDEPLAAYRLHTAQNWKVQTDLGARARKGLKHDHDRYAAIRAHGGRLGLPVADNLGDADLEHLNDRIVSLSFAPAEHPIQGDSISHVVQLAKAVRIEGESVKARLSRKVWWTLMGLLPAAARRQLLRWKMDPKARPAWLAATGRFLRTRLGIVVR
ncbi:MAG: glycosyltransferase family 2 protein [Hyphomonas sp.]